jgi:hypothetical protein
VRNDSMEGTMAEYNIVKVFLTALPASAYF